MSKLYHDVSQLDAGSLVGIARSLTGLQTDAECMEDVARKLVDHIYDIFCIAPGGPSQCSLVRLFKTCSQEELPREFQDEAAPCAPSDSRCLALLASRGEVPEWNDRKLSRNHQVISLESTQIVESIPMISNMIRMLGLDVNDVVKPNPELNVAGFYPLSVFYVEDALESPMIPNKQDFVVPYGVQSVVGFGGLLTFSDMFSLIMFFKLSVNRETASLFKDLGSHVHDLLMPFQNAGKIFRD